MTNKRFNMLLGFGCDVVQTCR